MFEIVSFPVLDENVQAYELAANVVPVFSCRATSVAKVVPSWFCPAVNPTLRFVGHVCRRDTLDVNESAMTCDCGEYACKMHAVHEASGFQHLDGIE